VHKGNSRLILDTTAGSQCRGSDPDLTQQSTGWRSPEVNTGTHTQKAGT